MCTWKQNSSGIESVAEENDDCCLDGEGCYEQVIRALVVQNQVNICTGIFSILDKCGKKIQQIVLNGL